MKLNREVWSARVDAAQAIPPGTEVRVSRIDGATAVVAPVAWALTRPHPPRSTLRAPARATFGGFMDNLVRERSPPTSSAV